MAANNSVGLRLSGILVLVFDRNEDTRYALKAKLELSGAIVSVARSPGELLAILAQFSPHVIVVDVPMPAEDWSELLNEARSMGPASRKISAIAITSQSNRAAALGSGFQASVETPIEFDVLCNAISVAAGDRRVLFSEEQ